MGEGLKMTYVMGASGLGHWVRRLQMTLSERENQLALRKAVGTKSYAVRRDELQRYGIEERNYFSIDPGEPLPDAFFDGLDVVYVASPNEFHKAQTLQALEKGKVTVTEKAFATTRAEFEEVVREARARGRDRVTLGLHYVTKTLTMELGKMLPSLVKRYGKVQSVVSTFFEEVRDEDARRAWLFKPENGGVAMDWIHPLSIISYVMKAERFSLQDCTPYVIQEFYDSVNPTGYHGRFGVKGRHFSQDAVAVVRVGKGVREAHKVFKVRLEDAQVELLYISTDDEFLTGSRGKMVITEKGGKSTTVSPSGPLSYEFMIDDMLRMLKGGAPMLSLEDITKIYEPEWQIQRGLASAKPVRKRDEIDEFVSAGLAGRL